jgi:hypothetical protein
MYLTENLLSGGLSRGYISRYDQYVLAEAAALHSPSAEPHTHPQPVPIH